MEIKLSRGVCSHACQENFQQKGPGNSIGREIDIRWSASTILSSTTVSIEGSNTALRGLDKDCHRTGPRDVTSFSASSVW